MAGEEKNVAEEDSTSLETPGASAKEQSGQLWLRVAMSVTTSSCLSSEEENCVGAGSHVAVDGRGNCRGKYTFNISLH